MNKFKQQYKDQGLEFKQVLLAELIDRDVLSANDAYYKKLDMTDLQTMEAINENIPTDNMNEIISEVHTYEQEQEFAKQMLKRREVGRQNLAKELQLPNDPAIDEVINAYDNSLTIGLSSAGVSSSKIQQAIPMLMSDLFVISQQERNYPFDFGDGNVANNASQYMAYSTQKLKSGLINDANYFDMLKSINDGNYDAYRIGTMNKNLYKQSKQLSRNIYKYR